MAKVGNILLEWSRELPSVPSSVTIIREADGRYCASFVVEVAPTPLPASRNDVGVDLGLARLATLSTGEVIENPRHLRRQARALARAQRALVPARRAGRTTVRGPSGGSRSCIAGCGRLGWMRITNWRCD